MSIRSRAASRALVVPVALAVLLLAGCGSTSSDAPPVAISRSSPISSETQATVNTSSGEVDSAIRAAFEGYIAAINDNRFEDAYRALSNCFQKSTSVEMIGAGRVATGRLTLRSIRQIRFDGAQALMATEVVSEFNVGSQNLFKSDVPMVLEDKRWRIDGPPKCTR